MERIVRQTLGLKPTRLSSLALASLFVAGVLAAQDRSEVRAYPVGLLDLETAVQVVRPLLSGAGTVVEDRRNHRLIVSDVPAVHDRVAAALKRIEAPARNVRITVTHRSERLDRHDAIEAGAGRAGVVVRGGASRRRVQDETRQQLLVLSGAKASIEVAEQVPYAEWFWSWGRPQGLWGQAVTWRDVGASLVVEPLVLDDHTLRIRVTPAFSYFVDRDRVVTEVHQLSTEVVAREGEEVDLGGLPVSNREFYDRFLVGLDRSGQTERVRITLRATVE